MKFQFDRKYLKICVYVFGTVAALLLFNRLLEASDDVWLSVRSSLSFLLTLLSPFITAIVLAYILSPAANVMEGLLRRIFKGRSTRSHKLVSLLLVYAILLALLAVTMSDIIPAIVRNIGDLVRNVPSYYDKLLDFYNNSVATHPLFTNDTVRNAVNGQIARFNENINTNTAQFLSGLTAFLMRFVSSVASLILGLVLSFYLLNEREHIAQSFNRLLRAHFGERRSRGIIEFFESVDQVFGKYISAKLFISLILFGLSFLLFSLLKVRYAELLSVVVAVTNLVPYIGPVLGAVPPVLIAFLDSPEKAVWTLVAILAMQAIDNYFIEPYVISDRMGLSPFWVLLSIIVGGGLFGVWGILLAVPIAAVIKVLISRYIIARATRRSTVSHPVEKPAPPADDKP